uniref:THAP-type domain-containing protein n=1 Tax=Amphiprion ocellaris TaxID=80972 RepID=A0AAQ5X8I3_AMPOC
SGAFCRKFKTVQILCSFCAIHLGYQCRFVCISRFLQLPWQYQQVWTRKGGTEYQTKNIKCNRTHSYIKRVSSHGGIKVRAGSVTHPT